MGTMPSATRFETSEGGKTQRPVIATPFPSRQATPTSKTPLDWPFMQDASIDAFTNLDGFAAQVAACNLIISIDNSTVHWLVHWDARCGRYCRSCPIGVGLLDRDDSPWYPSMRLFRQPTCGETISSACITSPPTGGAGFSFQVQRRPAIDSTDHRRELKAPESSH